MPKVLVAHPGTQYSHQLVKQLYRLNLLYCFHTGIAIADKSFFYQCLLLFPKKVKRKISNRIIEGVPAKFIKNYWLMELKALYKLSKGSNEEQVLAERNSNFQQAISDNDIMYCDVVIGFDTSSKELISRCKKYNKQFILDVSIAHSGYKDKVYNAILKQYPHWAFALNIKPDWQIKDEDEEINKADKVVVASSFTKSTLVWAGHDVSKIIINPYGVSSTEFKPIESKAIDKLKFVFVGLVDARKGIPLLLKVWKQLTVSNAELYLIGPISKETIAISQKEVPNVYIKGKIPFSELKKTLNEYDVMVFPSFFEGFGLVILEAMAAGLPVITTDATAGPDIIDNTEGWVIESGNEKQLSDAIKFCCENPDIVKEKSQTSRNKALQFTWDAYGERWKNIINNQL
jgi:starch synthase